MPLYSCLYACSSCLSVCLLLSVEYVFCLLVYYCVYASVCVVCFVSCEYFDLSFVPLVNIIRA